MPNHTANILILSGPKAAETIKAHLFSAKPDPELKPGQEPSDCLDFQSIIPMPEILKGIQSGSETDQGVAYLKAKHGQDFTEIDRMLGYQWPANLGITSREALMTYIETTRPKSIEMGLQAMKAHEETGFPTWYEWSIANWGTKWNAYDGKIEEERGPDWIALYFETAWSPPMPVLFKLKSMYPDLRMLLICADEGGGFIGAEEIVDSSSVDEIAETKEWDSPAGKWIRIKLGRYHEGRPPRSFKAPDNSWGWEQIMSLKS